MDCSSVHYSRHAIERIFQRGLSPVTIAAVLQAGEVIASYSDVTVYRLDPQLWEQDYKTRRPS